MLGFGLRTYTRKVSADHGPQSLLWEEECGVNRNRGLAVLREGVCMCWEREGSPEGLERGGQGLEMWPLGCAFWAPRVPSTVKYLPLL